MNAWQEKLFMELRQSKQEIEDTLKSKDKNNWITRMLEDELEDISHAIEKIRTGKYGECEASGEIIPDHLLLMLPTIRSMEDAARLHSFCRTRIHGHF